MFKHCQNLGGRKFPFRKIISKTRDCEKVCSMVANTAVSAPFCCIFAGNGGFFIALCYSKTLRSVTVPAGCYDSD